MRDKAWEAATIAGTCEVRVRVADTDMMGVVYNSNYLIWFEIGRSELMRDRGLTYHDVESRGLSLPVTEAFLRVRAPGRYDDLLQVETRVGAVRTRQVAFLYQIRRGRELLVEGETVHVPVRHGDARAVNIPDWLASVLRPL
jgi:acyl-CoA thioester hydrolase